MIERLHIENVALIEKINIDFVEGLNILSGETGAGKSIIIDSINFVLGSRADKSLIRFGEERCFVSAVFSFDDNEEIFGCFEELGVEKENTAVLSRILTVDGKTKCSINGQTVSLSMLKKLASMLVDVHGQSEHLSLLAENKQLHLIDKIADSASLISKVSEKLSFIKDIKKQIEMFGGDADERNYQIELLRFQIDEIEKADLQIGEDDKLDEMRAKVQNQEKITKRLTNSLKLLYEDDKSAVGRIRDASNNLSDIAEIDAEIDKEYERLDSVFYEIKDIVESLYSISESIAVEFNIEEIDDRLALIKKLKRKYGATIEQILETLDENNEKIDDLINAESKVSKLNSELMVEQKELFALCLSLSEKRKKCAKEFQENTEKQLQELSLKNTRFEIQFNDDVTDENYLSSVTSIGFDNVVFMFSANKGQPLKPLSKVISGGELSRFMLAVKNILSDVDNIGTMIFDEIDTGISGGVAHVVAEKFANISKTHQVIAISHLPQIVAMADKNFLIQKQVFENKTITDVLNLDYESTLKEIGRLSGGLENSDKTINLAKELKQKAEQYKEMIK